MGSLDEKILSSLKDISVKFTELRKEVMASLKLGSGEYKLVNALAANESINQTKLSDYSGLDRPQTSRLIGKLAKDGIIEKSYKEGNKKNIYVRLSEKGKALAKKIKQKTLQIKDKYFPSLNEKEKVTFLEFLTKNIKKEKTDA